jgi:hypothetical protein
MTLGLLPSDLKSVGFLIDATSYVLASCLFFGTFVIVEGIASADEKKEKEGFVKMWIEGLQPLKNPIIASVLAMFFFIMLGIAGVDVTFTAHTSDSGYESVYVGYIIGSLSTGMILTSIFGAKFIKKLPLFIQLGGSTAGLGIFYAFIGLSNHIGIMMAAAFFLGIL